MSELTVALAAGKNQHGKPCVAGVVVADLIAKGNEQLATELAATLLDPKVAQTNLGRATRAMFEAGTLCAPIPVHSVGYHRRGDCKCAR